MREQVGETREYKMRDYEMRSHHHLVHEGDDVDRTNGMDDANDMDAEYDMDDEYHAVVCPDGKVLSKVLHM